MSYLKYVTRSSEDRPCVGVAAVMRLEGGVCRNLRVVVGAVAETPQEFPEVEALLEGIIVTPEAIQSVASGYADRIDPIEDLRGSAWYRRKMVNVFVRRAIEEALARVPN
jgi:carbon-monoxide dehydrogenase medium subunit